MKIRSQNYVTTHANTAATTLLTAVSGHTDHTVPSAEEKRCVHGDSQDVTTLIPVTSPEILNQSYGVECAAIDDTQDMALLPSDSVMVEQQEVLQLHIEHNFTDETANPESNEGAQVILVYQDIFTCGACSKQFVELSEFLEHKSKHTIAENLYKCELCKMVLTGQDVLIDHYEKIHQCSMPMQGEEDKQDGVEADPAQPGSACIAADIEGISLERKTTGIPSMDSSTIDNIMNGTITVDGVAFVNNTLANNGAVVQTGLSIEPDSGNVGLQTPGVQTDVQGTTPTLPAPTLQARSLSNSTVEESTTALLQPASGIVESSLSAASVESFGQNGVVSGTNGQTVDSPNLEANSKTDFNFILQTEMVRGSSYTYGKTWFKCLHCDFKTHGKVAMTKHMHDRHGDLLDLHQSLDVKDVTANDKRKVMKMSTYESIFGRESRFRRRTKKGKRVEKQDIQGIFPCSTCGKVFTRLRYLRKHSETHLTEKKYLCDECGKSFKSRTYLSVHRRVHKEKLFRCNQCDFTSKINTAIHAHRQVHNQGSVLCDICGNAYTDRSTLSKHKRVHDLSRPYTCNYPGCMWRFKTEVMCKAHIRAHTTEGKFKCSFCGYLFRHKHHLQRHESSMHGVKHTKTRTNHVGASANKNRAEILDSDISEAVSLVINAEASDRLRLPSNLTQQHLVVATDTQGTPIAFEGGDLSSLNVAYQTLLQSQAGSDTHTLIMAQPDAQVVFQQE